MCCIGIGASLSKVLKRWELALSQPSSFIRSLQKQNWIKQKGQEALEAANRNDTNIITNHQRAQRIPLWEQIIDQWSRSSTVAGRNTRETLGGTLRGTLEPACTGVWVCLQFIYLWKTDQSQSQRLKRQVWSSRLAVDPALTKFWNFEIWNALLQWPCPNQRMKLSKKGNLADDNNWHGIMLLSVPARFCAQISFDASTERLMHNCERSSLVLDSICLKVFEHNNTSCVKIC